MKIIKYKNHSRIIKKNNNYENVLNLLSLLSTINKNPSVEKVIEYFNSNNCYFLIDRKENIIGMITLILIPKLYMDKKKCFIN